MFLRACRSCSAKLLPPAHSGAVGCLVSAQDFGFVFDEFSEFLVRLLLDFELLEQQLCFLAYTTAPFTNVMKMQSTPVNWVIAEVANGPGLALTLEGHTTHKQPPVRPQTVDGYPLSPPVRSFFHALLFHPSSP